MKYLVFAYDFYYPDGGWNDFKGSFKTVEEAETFQKADNWRCDFIEIVDIETMRVVKKIERVYDLDSKKYVYKEQT